MFLLQPGTWPLQTPAKFPRRTLVRDWYELASGCMLVPESAKQILIPLVSHFTAACPSITPRSAWEARETHCPQMNLPAKFVIIIHTAGKSCNESVDCLVRVRDTQSFHIDHQDFCDIAYK